MEVFPLIYGFLYVHQLPLIPACLLLVWILQALQLLGLEFPLNLVSPSFILFCQVSNYLLEVSSFKSSILVLNSLKRGYLLLYLFL